MYKFDKLYNKIIAEAETLGIAPEDGEEITIDVELSTSDDLASKKANFENEYGIQASYAPGFNDICINWTFTGPISKIRQLVTDYPEMQDDLEEEDLEKIFADITEED